MKHIIWDFNGTLLNDTQLSLDVDNNVFEKLGIPAITLDDYRNNMTMPVRDFYPAVGVDYSVHSYETIARLWLDEFNQKAGFRCAGCDSVFSRSGKKPVCVVRVL